MRQKYKPWAEPYLIANEERMITSPSAVDNYNNYHLHILEIGMGKGDFLLRMAKVYEETYFVGVELNKTCGAIAMKKIIEENIPNVYFYIGNASNLEEVLPSKMKFDAIYLNFPDPWPKIRHHKRRLTSKRFLDIYKKILKPGGKVILKTDHLELFDDSVMTFEQEGFKILALERNYLISSGPMSNYEEKYMKIGKKMYKVEVSYD